MRPLALWHGLHTVLAIGWWAPPQSAADLNARAPSEAAQGTTSTSAPRRLAQRGPGGATVAEPRRRASAHRLPPLISDRAFDHGVFALRAGTGFPSLYAVGVQLGVLGRLGLGGELHWLPGRPAPNAAPRIDVAFYRDDRVEIGAGYRQRLYPHPGVWPRSFPFQERDHIGTIFVAAGLGPLTGGGEIGVVVRRIPSREPTDDPATYAWLPTIGGGVFLRMGTPRWGAIVRGVMPKASIELVFEVRLGQRSPRAPRAPRPRRVVASPI